MAFTPVFRHKLAIVLFVLVGKCKAEAEGSESSESENTWIGVLALVASFVSLSTLVFCTWRWMRLQYRKLCPSSPPQDEDPPMAVYDSELGFPPRPGLWGSHPELHSTGVDHVEFEPLPELNFPQVILPEDEAPETDSWYNDPSRNFLRNRLEFVDQLGSGWFGIVVTAVAADIVPFPRRLTTVVKQLRDDASDSETAKFLHENRLYRDANHRNILKLLGTCLEAKPHVLILDLHEKGNFKQYLLESAKGVTLLDQRGANTRAKMALDVASGLQWMHDHNFLHPDLATRNCQVGAEGQVIIGDYGTGTEQFRDDFYWCRHIPLPIRWMAPESLQLTQTEISVQKVTAASNIWSFGVLLWEICELGKFPYAELNDEEVLTRVFTDRNYQLRPPSISMIPYPTLRAKYVEILNCCFNYNPAARPDIATVLKMLQIPL